MMHSHVLNMIYAQYTNANYILSQMLQIQEDYIAIRKGIQGKIEYLQQKRLLNLYPTLYLPPGWQPAVLEPPAILYKVGAARITAAEVPDNHCPPALGS
jgi:hypothetical protein